MNEDREAVKDILSKCVNAFCADYGYFSYPLSVLEPQIDDAIDTIATNGKNILINGRFLLEWIIGGKSPSALLMHTLLHNLLLHPFKVGASDYDLIADISVSNIVDDMNLRYDSDKALNQRKAVYKSIIDEFNVFNENSIGKFLSEKSESDKENLRELFTVCDHSYWRNNSNTGQSGGDKTDEKNEELLNFWKNVSTGLIESARVVGEAFSSAVKAAVGGKYDYRNFLKRFLTAEERIEPNDEEFDYIYYCLGLKNYGNMPLIENLEYKDDKDFSDVVIAIDTSGSTQGEPVKRFAEEMYSLVSQALIGDKVRFRIIECDSEIRDDVLIRDREQFENKMRNFEIKGGGGTDFRPVFDRLYSDKQSGRRIKGLIYFTDGYGIFPEKDLGIKTCFVLYGAYSYKVKTPYFAYRLELGGI